MKGEDFASFWQDQKLTCRGHIQEEAGRSDCQRDTRSREIPSTKQNIALNKGKQSSLLL